ncbi:hypothetical protein ACFC09_15450 [Streptomyces sp. NPDC056161]|uniref:hypothetical protein n=1 Tax=Streptomyces sp. NPDC056161 TaxID=3345732 RepID=UPI0035D7E574
MAREPKYTVKRTSDGTAVEEGDQLMVDHNLPVTYLGVASPPWGDDDSGEFFHGQVRVRYSWGAAADVQDVRAGVTVDEV